VIDGRPLNVEGRPGQAWRGQDEQLGRKRRIARHTSLKSMLAARQLRWRPRRTRWESEHTTHFPIPHAVLSKDEAQTELKSLTDDCSRLHGQGVVTMQRYECPRQTQCEKWIVATDTHVYDLFAKDTGHESIPFDFRMVARLGTHGRLSFPSLGYNQRSCFSYFSTALSTFAL
jgi:hypothetical protein